MADEEELRVMKLEFDWLLKEHLPKVLNQMNGILQDLKFKLPKVSPSGFRVFIRENRPWKLQQIQDAVNYLQLSVEKVQEMRNITSFPTGREVSKIVDDIANCLTKGKNCLMVPKKTSILDIINSSNQKSFKPTLPDEVVANFYINSDKLILSVFTLSVLPVPPQNPKQVPEADQLGFTLLTAVYQDSKTVLYYLQQLSKSVNNLKIRLSLSVFWTQDDNMHLEKILVSFCLNGTHNSLNGYDCTYIHPKQGLQLHIRVWGC